MFRAILLSVFCIATYTAIAAPPPKGSSESNDLGRYAAWFERQNGPWGSCCSVADGREVDVQIRDGHYFVRFIHPETIDQPIRPEAGKWYVVPDKAVLRGTNPTGYAIAWWFGYSPIFEGGKMIGFIRCFIDADMT